MNNFKILVVLTLVLSWVSCNDFLDINDNPNNPTEVTLRQLLPTAMLDVSGAMGITSGGMSNFASLYVHQTVQRGAGGNDYGFNGDDFGVSVPWTLLYPRALTDLRQIEEQGAEEESWAYVGIAKLLRAYSFSMLVDVYGDIPYTEAGLGAENPNPAFDDDQAIYESLLVLIDEAIADLAKPSASTPSNDDLFYGGDLDKWERFANVLKLKMYNQARSVLNVDGEINTILNNGMVFRDMGDDFEMDFGTSSAPDNRNPAYTQEYAPGGASNYISPYFFEIMAGLNTFFDENPYSGITDPRIPYYFYNQLPEGATDGDAENPCSYCPSNSNTPFLSIYAFSFNIDPNEGFDQSSSQTVMGLYPIGGRYDDGEGEISNYNGAAISPQRLLTYYAQKYIEAELALDGVIAGDDAALFEEAMRASFDKVNQVAANGGAPLMAASDIEDYITAVMDLYNMADDATKLEHIMTQKWIASFGFAVDAYTDYRRTGFPRLHDGDTDALDVTDRTRDFPNAYPWPTDELRANPMAPEQKNVVNYRVFWDN